MEKKPKVSVLVPTYNYGRFLGEAIDSVLNQTFTDFEVIILDNNSSDNTAEVVQPYLKDSRIIYYKNPVNIGMTGNFNKCLEYANGEYIKFLLADDKFHPDLLKKFVHILDTYPNVCLVTSRSESFGLEKGLRVSPLENMQPGQKVIQESIKDGRGNFIGEPTTVMFRASNLVVGNFNPQFPSLNDLNFWLRQLTIGDCYFVPEVLSYFRVHENQATIVNRFVNWFDEYTFYKRLKTNNEYKVDFTGLNLDKTIKKTALKSASAMYTLLPDIAKKKYRTLFKTAMKIAIAERVVASSLFEQITGSKKKYTAGPQVVV